MDQVDCLVVGAGAVGLAAARALALAGREVVIAERGALVGGETSSRNSEVIHAGIYYAPGSLMARLCVAGRAALYAYCGERGVPHRRCGKLIVAASPQESARLAAIKAGAEANGVGDLEFLDARAARELEPALHCDSALLSPSTGILDSHAYMQALLGDAEAHGAALALNTPILGAKAVDGGFEVAFGGAAPGRLRCAALVNAAGHGAPELAARLEGMPQTLVPRAYYAKGSYFALSGRSPFSRLIYPVPVPGGLGTHLTLDMAGQARFGPDVEWIDAIDYAVDPARADGFYAAIRRYWPDIRDGALTPAYAGVRPKIVPRDGGRQDFVIQGAADHGVAGLVNLFGIESPGLTASLALGDAVAALALQ